MTDPIEQLMHEHQEGLAALDRLEKDARQVAAEGLSPATREAMGQAISFINGEIRGHNEKEEEVLFPALAPFLPNPGGPVDVMLAEHRDLWTLNDRLVTALAEPSPDRANLSQTALGIVQLLRSHISKEDNILYPMARRFLGEEGLAEVARKVEALQK